MEPIRRLKCRLRILPKSPGVIVGNHALDVLFGAEIVENQRPEFDQNRDAIVLQNLAELRAAGLKPRWVPMGASEPLGCWGYLRAMRELADDFAAHGIDRCDLVMAISSAGTYAGALLGKWRYELSGVRIWAVPVSDDVSYFQAEVRALCEATITKYGLPFKFDAAEMNFIDGFVGDGYAIA